MIKKLIFPDAFDFGMPTASLVPLHSRGVDDGWLHKRAAMFDNELDGFERRKGHQYIHLISVGAWERYGCNNNADAFIRKTATHTCPHPKDPSRKTITLDGGGLLAYHDKTFLTNGAVFKNHENRHKDGTPSGYIVKAAYNHNMDRGELIVGVDEKLWRKELQKVANGEPIFFSMGADCPSDVCSYCHNEARTLKQYCDHLKKFATQIAGDGTQVCALTDKPFFHDISGVGRPAEKICFGLRKVAGDVLTGAELAEMYALAPPAHMFPAGTTLARKFDLLQKLAKIEKEILLSSEPEPGTEAFCPGSGFGEVDDNIVRRMADEDPHAVLGALKRFKVVLPADLFFRMIMGDKFADISSDMDSVKDSLPGVMNRLLENPDLEKVLTDGSYEPAGSCGGAIGRDAEAIAPECSIHAEPIRVRVIRAVVNGAPVGGKTIIEKKAGQISERVDMLATEYANYLLTFADGLSDTEQRLSVVQLCATV